MNSRDEYQIAPVWNFPIWMVIGMAVFTGLRHGWDTGDVLGFVVVGCFLAFSMSYRLHLDEKGFLATYFPANLIRPPKKIIWADVVGLSRWEFIAFEESWGIQIRFKDPLGKTRQVIIPGILRNMPDLLEAILQRVPPSTSIDPFLKQRVATKRRPRRSLPFHLLARTGILVLVALCIALGVFAFISLENLAAKMTAAAISIALVGYLGSKIYRFR